VLFEMALESLEEFAHSGSVGASDGDGVEDPSERPVLESVGRAHGQLSAGLLCAVGEGERDVGGLERKGGVGDPEGDRGSWFELDDVFGERVFGRYVAVAGATEAVDVVGSVGSDEAWVPGGDAADAPR